MAKGVVWAQRSKLGLGLALLFVDRAAGFVVPLAPKVLLDEVVAHRRTDLLVWLAVAVVGVVISIYYYFGWIRAAFFEAWTMSPAEMATRPARTDIGLTAKLVLGLLAFCTVLLGFYQGALGGWLTMR